MKTLLNIVGAIVICMVLVLVTLRFTGFGRAVLAVGGNEEAARLMGLPVDRVKIGAYVLSGTLAGLAGVVLASQTSGSPTEGVGWELIAIASVVVGGTLLTGGEGSILNTVTGVLLLAVILNLINFENGLATSNPGDTIVVPAATYSLTGGELGISHSLSIAAKISSSSGSRPIYTWLKPMMPSGSMTNTARAL